MRFFHISDLHIGKQLNGADLTDDLRHILFGQVLGSAYEKYRPDGLIIAGDIYDRSTPSAEGVTLFDEFLCRAAELKLPVYAISGNHDNAQRVGYGRRLFLDNDIHISAPFSADAPLTVAACGDIDIALLPYFSAETAAEAFPDDDICDINSALRVVFDRAGIPKKDRPCLLVAHLSVGGSDKTAVGSLETVDHHVFEPFVYTALGHFHDPHFVGGGKVRYCGSPLCFSLKEARLPQKYIDVIDVSPDGSVEVANCPIQPLRAVAVLSDSFDELLSDKYAPTDDYVFITVNGENAETDAARRLMIKFPNCISIKYDQQQTKAVEDAEYSTLDFEELFSGFFSLAMGSEIEPSLLEEAKNIFREAEGENKS